ncbi:MAG: hypothetical protein ABS948_11980 [Solibacillus sp.]
MDKALFDEIKKSLSVITEGNWTFVCHDDGKISLVSTKGEELHQIYKEKDDWMFIANFLGTTKVCDTNFIANSKKYVQDLVTEIERLTDTVHELYAERISLIMIAEMNEAQLLADVERLGEEVKSSRRAFNRKHKEAKVLANICHKHKVLNNELVKVLSYYANADNYVPKDDLCQHEMDLDVGHKARKALASIKA